MSKWFNIKIWVEVKTKQKRFVYQNLVFPLSFPVTHFIMPQKYLVTPWTALTLVGNYCTKLTNIVQTSSTSSSCNSNMLLTYWCLSINNLMRLCIIMYKKPARGTKQLLLQSSKLYIAEDTHVLVCGTFTCNGVFLHYIDIFN